MSIAFITGGSRGLGKSMAQELAAKGVDIVFTYHAQKADADALVQELTASGRKAAALQLDVSKPETFDGFAKTFAATLLQTFGRPDFDYLVNNAGTGLAAPLAEATAEQFDEMLNIHLKGPFFLTQKLLPLIKDGGRILNISTGLTRFSFPGYGPYAMMKGALEVYTRYLALELSARRIAR